MWGTDVISGDADAGGANAARISHDVINRIHSLGKGIVLFHDIKRPTAEALDGILTELEKENYKYVQVLSNTNYQPDPQLIARADLFRSKPETATITGTWTTSPKEQVKDGSVDVMHTEWIDLDAEIANEKLNSTSITAPAGQPHAAAQPSTMYTATGWAPGRLH